MKSLVPWFCLVAASSSMLHAADGLEAYRQGDYARAAENINAKSDKDPVANYYLGMMRLYGYGQLKNSDLALRFFTESAEKGYLPAQKLLGSYYINHDQDPEQALQWYKKAAAANDIPSKMYVAAAYLFGYGVKKNDDIARRYYIDAAKSGNNLAQYTLGINFLTSRDNINKKMGLIWLTKAAQNGNAQAQFKLANMYATGSGVESDQEKAKDFYTSAAQQDFPPAMLSLAEIAQKEGDLQQAKEWFTRAAERGSHDAQLALAQIYKEGKGVPVDAILAQQWEQMASKTAVVQADTVKTAVAKWLSNNKSDSLDTGDYQLGGIYTAWRNPSTLKDNTYNQAPQMNVITRQALYKPQFVVAKPAEIPISEYFDIMAPMMSGNELSVWSFPRYELDGQIEAVLHDDFWVIRHDPDAPLVDRSTPYQTDQSPVKPFDYLAEQTPGWEHQVNLQAVLSELYGQAILGESSAQFELGQLYQYGVGVAKNISQAITYFQLAAMQQDVRAEYNLGILYLEGQTNPVDYSKGIEWMMDAAFKGNPYAQYVLANIYEKGLTDPTGVVMVQPDHQQAMAMYYLASSNNYGDAEYRLADYLVKEKKTGLSVLAKQNRNKLVKRLYQGAVDQGVAEAVLPLAFYYAMDSDPDKQNAAFQVAKEQAQAGNNEAALLLGIMYERGISVPKNQAEAVSWFKMAGMDNPISAFILGTYYSLGEGVDKDTDRGHALLQRSADAGFSYADLNLAILQHQMGEPFLKELDLARQYGNSKAGLLLADYYLLEANDPEKMKQAAEIYQYFAEKGDRDAQMKLGFLYDRGLGGEANNELAARWYTQAAEQGQAVAQYLLAQLYQLGRLDKQPDYTLAKKWYKESLASFPQASTALGFIYDTVDNDYSNAAINYVLAGNAGDPRAQFDLGLIYDYGKGVAVDPAKAINLYTQAANAGYAKAMTQLAVLNFKGVNGQRDIGKALYWYKKAAALGESGAMYQLGLMSETGVSATVNIADAVKYYQGASEQGNEKAKLALARMYQYGLGVDRDYAHATDIYKQLAANDNAYAQYQLATICLDGLMNDCRPEQGKLWLQQAENNGNQQARIKLQWLNAQHEPRVSFIEPEPVRQAPIIGGQSAELMYLDALSEWNRGNETSSREILNQIVNQFPRYEPAMRTYKQLSEALKAENKIG